MHGRGGQARQDDLQNPGIKMADRKNAVYRIYENGEKQLIARVTSPFEAIDIAAEHYGETERTTIAIGSIDPEPDEARRKL